MKSLHCILTAFALLCFLSSCTDKQDPKPMLGEEYAIKGTSRFLSNVPTTSPFLTKYGEITEDEARSFMTPILEASYIYLADNGYDFSEDFDSEDDPRIAWVAFGLAEYDLHYCNATKTSIGGCVLQAIGVAGLVDKYKEKAVKVLVKAIAKEVAKKIVPYVGAAITVGDFIWCMVDD